MVRVDAAGGPGRAVLGTVSRSGGCGNGGRRRCRRCVRALSGAPRRRVDECFADLRHPALPQNRLARTVGAVAAALATTIAGHLLATGASPPLTGLLVAAAIMAAPAWLLARDERGWERLAAAQLVAQLGGHALFVVTATDPVTHAGHAPFGPELVLFAHVVGAAAAGAWLRCGERRAIMATRRAVAALRRLVTRLLGDYWRAACGPAARRPSTAPALGVPAARLRHSIVHRGPPAVC
jgi:hypothetical protein